MMKIYAINISNSTYREKEALLFNFISDERMEEIHKFKFDKDKRLALFGEILLRYAIMKNFHKKNADIHFYQNNFGKPFLKNSTNIHFNLSHSGDWVVCAVSDYYVGIDIEEIKPIDLSLAKSFFHFNEHSYLSQLPKTEQVEQFYAFWCLKESYVKYVGKGLAMPLNSFYFTINQNRISLNTLEIFSEKLNFETPVIDPGYKLAVCYSVKAIQSIEQIDSSDLLASFNTDKQKLNS